INWGLNPIMNGEAIQHALGSPHILLRSCQTYLVSYSVIVVNTISFTAALALQLNGVTVFGSITQIFAGLNIISTLSATVFIETGECDNNTLTVVSPLGISTASFFVLPGQASLTILKLN